MRKGFDMNLTRRGALAFGAAAATIAVLPRMAFAATDTEAAIAAFTGGAAVAEGGVDITAPEIAENGNTVPVVPFRPARRRIPGQDPDAHGQDPGSGRGGENGRRLLRDGEADGQGHNRRLRRLRKEYENGDC